MILGLIRPHLTIQHELDFTVAAGFPEHRPGDVADLPGPPHVIAKRVRIFISQVISRLHAVFKASECPVPRLVLVLDDDRSAGREVVADQPHVVPDEVVACVKVDVYMQCRLGKLEPS